MRRLIATILCAGTPALAFGQVYATAQVGYASADFSLGAPYNGVVDDRAVSLGVDVGFNITKRFAFEVGATRYGGFDGRATPCAPGAVCTALVQDVDGNDATALALTLIPHVELGDTELFGKIGYYRLTIDTEIDIPGGKFKERGIVAGIGARWYFREPWSVSLEASRLDDNVYQIELGAGWGLRLGERDGRRERNPPREPR